jgi:tRNA pseudouridine55 synthase
LVEDIGDALDVGAHVTRLHRVYTAGFEDLPMYTLEQLNEMSLTEQLNCLIPMDRAVEYLTPVTLSDDEVLILRQGRILGSTVSSNEIDCVRLYDERNQFIGLGERQINGDLKAKRLLAF